MHLHIFRLINKAQGQIHLTFYNTYILLNRLLIAYGSKIKETDIHRVSSLQEK
jgi:hypothetical protein